jgi:hypothetical protein
MPYVTGPILREGPVLDLWIGVSEPRRGVLLRVGFAVPGPVAVRALINTSSACSQAAAAVFEALDLTPVAAIGATAGGVDVAETRRHYDVSLWAGVPEPALCSPLVTMAEAEFPADTAIRALIGRDVLGHGLLVYDGRRQTFTLTF